MYITNTIVMSEIKNKTKVFIYKINLLHESNFNNIKEPWKIPLGSELFNLQKRETPEGWARTNDIK